MSVGGGVAERVVAPSLPRSIWLVAWASVTGQVLLLVQQGVRRDGEFALVTSVVLGALVVGWVSAGVVRARAVRLFLAWAALAVSGISELIRCATADDAADLAFGALLLSTTLVAVFGLARFQATEWYAWQRTKPSTQLGPPIGQLVALGVLVGVLAGLTGPVEDGAHVRITVAER